MLNDFLGDFFFCSEVAEFLHVDFNSVKQHRPCFFFPMVSNSFSRKMRPKNLVSAVYYSVKTKEFIKFKIMNFINSFLGGKSCQY